MDENIMQSQPELAENSGSEDRATTPEPTKTNERITLKFNKEIREISYDEAVALAQKGLKFDKISDDLTRLRTLAQKRGKSITDYISDIEKGEAERRRAELLDVCKNEELTEHILSLEGEASTQDASLTALNKEFPEIKSMDDLPDEVKANLALTGGNALSAYLLYLHRQQSLCEQAKLKQSESRAASVGSKGKNAAENSGGVEEFIKGIWS